MRALLRTTVCLGVLMPFALLVAGSAFPVTITSAGSTGGATSGAGITARNIASAMDDPYCSGTILAIQGTGFADDGGTRSVTIGGVPAAYFTVGSDRIIYAQVGRGATTGPIVVSTPAGSFSSESLPGGRLNPGDTSIQGNLPGIQIVPCVSKPTIVKAAVAKIKPNPSKGGQKVQLIGSGFSGVTKVTVGGVVVPFAVAQDQNIFLIVPKTAKNGKLAVVVTNSAGTTTSTVNIVKKG